MNEMDEKIKQALERAGPAVAKPAHLQSKEIQVMIAQVKLESAKKLRFVKWVAVIDHVLVQCECQDPS